MKRMVPGYTVSNILIDGESLWLHRITDTSSGALNPNRVKKGNQPN